MTKLPDHLQRAAQTRTQQAEQRANTALAKLVKTGTPISFAAVARTAEVSTDFLYNHQELRREIEKRRTTSRGAHRPTADGTAGDAASTSSAVRALSHKLSEERRIHHEAIKQLREALAAAQGENLELRRRLAQYEPA
ncbi:DUF6262 family protein [Actinomadura geliboluensis]|uniref:Transposase n=1 Tax=Actinomadura geliboluensis TaxID=882440 RepID=A0A5S4H703_9ACTN|nr:DUF6262 family protein [Actinomadura geliboluensis]TMR40534.1 transposase [Actinomadura geliboluensis]